MTTPVDAIVSTVLYEGYLLWPYRRSAAKNRKRWTLGGVYPREFSEPAQSGDPWWRQAACLVEGHEPTVTVTVKFLQVVQRQLYRGTPEQGWQPVDELQAGTERYVSWEEAAERTMKIEHVVLATAGVREVPIHLQAGMQMESVGNPEGQIVGILARRWRSLQGTIEIQSMPVAPDLFLLRIRISNTTPWNGADRDEALRHTFVSTHDVLSVEHGRFVSLLDPPERCKAGVERCRNIGMWPVLVGDPEAQNMMLSSPIILYDYPQVAPESPGDLFDGTEIDQLLTLNILAMTEEEKAEMRSTDDRGRAILARTESLTEADFMRLHGTIRDIRDSGLEKPVPRRVVVGGVDIGKGSRVRLLPRPGGDVWDVVLAGQTACVETIEQDFEDRVYLAVSLDADPGRDLAGISPGHRFYFSPNEVEVLDVGDERPQPTQSEGGIS